MNETNTFPSPYWLLDRAEDKQTEFVIVLVSTGAPDDAITLVQQLLAKDNIVVDSTNSRSNSKAAEIFITASSRLAWALYQKLLALMVNAEVDIAVLPVAGRKKELLVCDMDSTIVQTETLDDIAERIGIGEQVSEITERAMSGELDFCRALDERVSLLSGIPEKVFVEIAAEVQFNPGAEILLRSAKAHGLRTVLVSGGFEPIVSAVAATLGFDRYVCNKVDVVNGQLSGKVLAPIVDGETKLNVLLQEAEQLGIKPEQACALGDGANDLPMLQAAGLGIGFKGKPLIRSGTPHQINSSGLDAVLSFMGIA